jgi:uncharacterized membrane protein
VFSCRTLRTPQPHVASGATVEPARTLHADRTKAIEAEPPLLGTARPRSPGTRARTVARPRTTMLVSEAKSTNVEAVPSKSPSVGNDTRQRWQVPRWVPRPSLWLWVLLLLAGVETAILSWAQWQNYLAFVTSQGNLGNYNQAFYTTVTGQGWFYYTVNLPSGSRGTLLAVHFSPTFFALAPLYALDPSPVALLVLKQAALAFAAVPIYGLARIYFRGEALPFALAGLYLLSPLATNVDWNNADPEAFLPITLLFALYFFARGRLWPFLLCWILALGTIEAAPPLLILFAIGALIGTVLAPRAGVYWSAVQQRKPLLVALAVAVLWLVISLTVLYASGPRGGAFGASYARRYSVLGASSLPDVVVQAAVHPALAAQAFQFQGGEKLLLLAVLVAAGGLFWVFGGLRYLLPIGGYLLLAFLSNASVQYSLGTEYLALVAPFVFAGMVEGLAWTSDTLGRKDPGWRHRAVRAGLQSSFEDWKSIPANAGRPVEVTDPDSLGMSFETYLSVDDLPRAEATLNELRARARVSLPVWGATPMEVDSTSVPGPDPAVSAGTPAGRGAPGRRRPFGSQLRSIVLVTLAAVSIVVLAGISGPLLTTPVGGQPGRASGVESPDAADHTLAGVLALIPPAGSVLTTNHLFPQVSDRRSAYTVPQDRYLPNGVNLSDDFGRWVNASDYVAVDYSVDTANSEILMTMSNLSGFGVLGSSASAVLYERGWNSAPTLWHPFSESLPGASLKGPGANSSGRFATSLGPSLYHAPGGTVGQRIWNGPNLIALPLGTYRVTVVMEISSSHSGDLLDANVTWTPARVVDTPVFSGAGETYYSASVSMANSPADTLASRTVSTSAPTSGYVPVNLEFNVTLANTGYLSIPAYEQSTSMSVYLVSLQFVEISGLA